MIVRRSLLTRSRQQGYIEEARAGEHSEERARVNGPDTERVAWTRQKGLAVCLRCGAGILPDRRKVACWETLQCTGRASENGMRARGLVRVGKILAARLARVNVETAPGQYYAGDQLLDGNFARARDARTNQAFSGLNLHPPDHDLIVKICAVDDEVNDALEAFCRMGASGSARYRWAQDMTRSYRATHDAKALIDLPVWIEPRESSGY